MFCQTSQTFHLIGGGQLCLGFGAHYCQSLIFSITHDYQLSDPKEISESVSIPNKSKHKVAAVTAVENNTLVIYISSQMLKKTKTFLEDKNYFDKTRRITPADTNVPAVQGMFAVPVKVGFIECLRDNKFSQSTIKDLVSFINSSKSCNKVIPIKIGDVDINEETSDSINLFYGFQSPFLNKVFFALLNI